jgi:hypothetical protein
VLASGGGLTVNGAKYSGEDLRLLAAAANSSGAQLIISGGRISYEHMRSIAAGGRGHVAFADEVF